VGLLNWCAAPRVLSLAVTGVDVPRTEQRRFNEFTPLLSGHRARLTSPVQGGRRTPGHGTCSAPESADPATANSTPVGCWRPCPSNKNVQRLRRAPVSSSGGDRNPPAIPDGGPRMIGRGVARLCPAAQVPVLQPVCELGADLDRHGPTPEARSSVATCAYPHRQHARVRERGPLGLDSDGGMPPA